MITPIRVPKLGMTQDSITVVKWLKADGEVVEKGETVVVIETAKVSYEVEAAASGLVFSLRNMNDKVRIGEILGVVADGPEEFEAYKLELSKEKEARGEFLFEEGEEKEGVRISFEEGEEKEKGVIPVSRTQIFGDRKILKRIPFAGMRRRIAENLFSSLHSGAQLTIVSETDMTELDQFRQEFILDHPENKITFVDMLVKLLAFTLQEFPIMNSTLVGNEIICWGEYNIGVAVALEDGLMVPVVRNADTKSLLMISREVKKLSQKARSNELEPAHYKGGTFTLSSGGKVDTDIITPIINPPENAILAVGKIGPKPAVHAGQLAIRTMSYLCLTFDHRVIDGVPASLFLGRLKEVIEHPDQFRKILR
ncbi:MAG: dihydrolipoamide acetyltransferase family protein [Thermodesulfobacteriota bacterium]|nr:dihydrolipoamide acetyltransferase family protein [Thermodesulfobacteriota bacterium]